MRDLIAAQMNVWRKSLIMELIQYNFELGHDVTEATKNIDSAKGEGTVDHMTVNR